jgi:aspartyl-tRNA(Asn)/glutamyl-tRNA(Gln) amidotransferase subunit A
MLSKRTKDSTAGAIAGLARRWANAGIAVSERASPLPLADILAAHRHIMLAELGRTHANVPRDKVAPRLAADMDAGLAMLEVDYVTGQALLRDRRS